MLDSPDGGGGGHGNGSLHGYVPTDVQLQLPWHFVNEGHGGQAITQLPDNSRSTGNEEVR
jgi:hypothetical protein